MFKLLSGKQRATSLALCAFIAAQENLEIKKPSVFFSFSSSFSFCNYVIFFKQPL